MFLWLDSTETDLTAAGLAEAVALNDQGDVLGTGVNGEVVIYRFADQGLEELNLPASGAGGYFPRALSDTGEVAIDTTLDAIVWSEGGQQQSFQPPAGFVDIIPTAINDQGSVVGVVFALRGQLQGARAFVYSDGIVTLLEPNPGGDSSWATAVNDVGQIVGGAAVAGHGMGDGRAFVYDFRSGEMVDVGTLTGYEKSAALGINNAGQVVGFAWGPLSGQPPFKRAFIYDHRDGTIADLNDLILPDAGWFLADAVDINDAGQIVGQGTINGQVHAFLLDPVSQPQSTSPASEEAANSGTYTSPQFGYVVEWSPPWEPEVEPTSNPGQSDELVLTDGVLRYRLLGVFSHLTPREYVKNYVAELRANAPDLTVTQEHWEDKNTEVYAPMKVIYTDEAGTAVEELIADEAIVPGESLRIRTLTYPARTSLEVRDRHRFLVQPAM